MIDGAFVGVEVRCRREALGLSQVAFAKYLNVNPNTVYRWEADKSMTPGGVLAELDVLENEVRQLVTRLVADATQYGLVIVPEVEGFPAVLGRVAAARTLEVVGKVPVHGVWKKGRQT